MTLEWTNEETLLFLELYRDEEVLWDPSHNSYKDRKKINDAWVRISDNTPNRTVAELKKKKESLMSSFRSHLRKKKSSIRSGAGSKDIYKPVWFAYQYMEDFLGQIYEVKSNTETQDDLLTTDFENPYPTDPATDEDHVAVENMEESTELQPKQILVTPGPSTHRKTAAGSMNCRRSNPPELVEAGNQMQQALLQNVAVDDECDLYGKLIAKKLRKVPEEQRDLIMYDIDGIFIRRKNKRSRPEKTPPH